MKRFEAYEDNSGGIWMFLLDDAGNAFAGFGNFEYNAGSLADAIDDLKKDPDGRRTWGGDLGGDIEMPHRVRANPETGEWEDGGEMTAEELRREFAEERTAELVAWSSDGERVEYCKPEKMGIAARKALNISIDD